MVSVVCGHSLCRHCADHCPLPPHSSDTDSSASDDPDRVSQCPVCSVPLAGFVKNFEALATLQSPTSATTPSATATPQPAHQPATQPLATQPSDAPDLTSVVTGDLVIDRRDIYFNRTASNELGRGASAVVYKGTFSSNPVAIKSIRTMSDTFTAEDRLRRELRNASRLKNPYIVEFRGAAWDHEDGPTSPRNVLLVTELMPGGNLRESLNSLSDESGLAVDAFVNVALQISRGIEYLHAEGLAHRDVKSANILLTERLPKFSNRFSTAVRAKIADFGLSKYIDKATGGGTVMQSIMEPGRLEATYAYLAPEAFGGDKSNVMRKSDSEDEADSRYDDMAKKRDIYALGVLFWEMLTGQIPWSGVSLPDVYVRVCVRSDRPAPALDDTHVDRTFHRLIDRCWAQNPSRRPSARSIVAKLEKLATKYCVTDPSAAAAAVESVSVVSGQAPNLSSGANPAGGVVDAQSEILKDVDTRDMHLPSESLMSYQKMPSASTVHTIQNDETKTHSIHFEASEGGLDRTVDDIPMPDDDPVWVDDGDINGKSSSRRASLQGGINHSTASASAGATGHSQGHSQGHNHHTEGKRQPARRRTSGSDNGGDAALTRVASHNVPSSHVHHTPLIAAAGVTSGAAAQGHTTVGGGAVAGGGNTPVKSSATAVAATAAAIAAAKDRERKRDDVRFVRNATTAAARVARGTTAGAGETSFQSLTGGAGETWTRNGKEKERVVFYDNSDEEAQDFDPDRAAADEAIAESNCLHITGHAPVRSVTPVSRSGAGGSGGFAGAAPQTTRSTSLGRVTGRPKSPIVRRPMSPAVGRAFTPGSGSGHGRNGRGDEDVTTMHSLSRVIDGITGAPVPKRSASASRGRLGRTLSASAQGNNAARAGVAAAAVAGSAGNIANGAAPSNGATAGAVGANVANTNGSGGLVTSNSTTAADASKRRAFIRRMRSNETSRKFARSSSSTGFERKRGKGSSGASGGGGSSGGMVKSAKSTPSHISDTVVSEDDLDEEENLMATTGGVGIGGSGMKSANSGTVGQENFMGIVEALDKTGLMRLLAQRMQPLRLAALAHAALLSAKHRNDEEVLRNCCAYLHRLTVPSSSSSSSGVASSSVAHRDGRKHHHGSGHGHEVSAKEQLSIRKYLKGRQGVEALLQALHPPEVRHPTTLCYGLLALGNLTAWDLEAHKQFRNSHGVVQVTQVMKVHSQNGGVQEKGCYALACVGAVYPAKSKNIFEQSGALDVVIRVLSDVQGKEANDAVTKQACAALGAMCSSSSANALYAGRKDALAFLVTSFERFRKASKGDGGGKRSEMRLVCKAFIDLLCNAENRKVAGAKGGSTMIIRAMRIFRLDADFIEKGLITLSQFCTLRSNGSQIVQANGVDDIVAAMERFRMSMVMQREGCRVLALLINATGDQARRRMVHAGGAEAIVFALERFGAIPDTHEDVVLEACRALDILFLMDNAAEGESLGRRMRKIRCDKAVKTAMMTHRGEDEIQEAAKDALRHLSALRGGGGLWSRMRNGSKKW